MEKIPLFTSGQVQNTFKILHFWLNFMTWPKSNKLGVMPSATFLALNNSLQDLPWKFLFCHENKLF